MVGRMKDANFRNLDELYNRIKPALYSKVQEIKRNGISYIKEEDIWNYLSLNKWKNSESLTLNDMVSDILNLKEEDVKSYVLDLVKKRSTEIITEESSLL